MVVKNINPSTHTRLPRYVRDKLGCIDRDHGVFIFADTHAMTRDKKPQHCYSVRFAARELWGPDAHPNQVCHIDLFEPYIQEANR